MGRHELSASAAPFVPRSGLKAHHAAPPPRWMSSSVDDAGKGMGSRSVSEQTSHREKRIQPARAVVVPEREDEAALLVVRWCQLSGGC